MIKMFFIIKKEFIKNTTKIRQNPTTPLPQGNGGRDWDDDDYSSSSSSNQRNPFKLKRYFVPHTKHAKETT
jgi:hypothetical protein